MGGVNENFPSASSGAEKRDTELTRFGKDRREFLKGLLVASAAAAGVGGVSGVVNAAEKLASLGEADPNLLGVEMKTLDLYETIYSPELNLYIIKNSEYRITTTPHWLMEKVMLAVKNRLVKEEGKTPEEAEKEIQKYYDGKIVKKVPYNWLQTAINIREKKDDGGDNFYWKNSQIESLGFGKIDIGNGKFEYFIKASGISPKKNKLDFFVRVTNEGEAFTRMICFQINDEIPPRLHSQSKGWGRGTEKAMFEKISQQLKAAKIAQSQKGEQPVAQQQDKVQLGGTISNSGKKNPKNIENQLKNGKPVSQVFPSYGGDR